MWDKLLPGFTAGKLEASGESVAELNAKLKGLAVPVPVKFKGKTPDVVAHEYEFPANTLNLSLVHLEATSLWFEFGEVHSGVTLEENVWTPCKKKIAWGRMPAQPAAACGNWTAADTFTLKLCFVETPFIVTIRMKFGDGTVKLESEMNVGFGATKDAPLVGKKK